MKTFEINEELAQQLISYLAPKPYEEVYVLIARLQSMKEVLPPEEDELPKED